MPMTPVPPITLTPVAYFPEMYFLENFAVRADGSVLVTSMHSKELWCVPGPEPRAEVPPVLVHTFDHLIWGIAEAEPDVFIVNVTDSYATHESYLARVDFNGWAPGKPVSPEIIYTFDDRAPGRRGRGQAAVSYQLHVTVLYDEPRVPVVPLDHRLAGKESVTVDDIAG
jgi:hypothetical protein